MGSWHLIKKLKLFTIKTFKTRFSPIEETIFVYRNLKTIILPILLFAFYNNGHSQNEVYSSFNLTDKGIIKKVSHFDILNDSAIIFQEKYYSKANLLEVVKFYEDGKLVIKDEYSYSGIQKKQMKTTFYREDDFQKIFAYVGAGRLSHLLEDFTFRDSAEIVAKYDYREKELTQVQLFRNNVIDTTHIPRTPTYQETRVSYTTPDSNIYLKKYWLGDQFFEEIWKAHDSLLCDRRIFSLKGSMLQLNYIFSYYYKDARLYKRIISNGKGELDEERTNSYGIAHNDSTENVEEVFIEAIGKTEYIRQYLYKGKVYKIVHENVIPFSSKVELNYYADENVIDYIETSTRPRQLISRYKFEYY